jgi:hypothetical protein
MASAASLQDRSLNLPGLLRCVLTLSFLEQRTYTHAEVLQTNRSFRAGNSRREVMSAYIVAPLLGLAGVVGCYLWGAFIDGSLRPEPSDRLGYAYLGVLTTVGVFSSQYLDAVRTHPYRCALIVFSFLALVVWSAVPLFRKAKKWDEDFHRRRKMHSQNR